MLRDGLSDPYTTGLPHPVLPIILVHKGHEGKHKEKPWIKGKIKRIGFPSCDFETFVVKVFI